MSYATPSDTPDTPKKRESLGGWLRFLLTFAVLAWLLRSLVIAPFSIPSGSMLPNLLIGDYVMVAKWPYGYSRYSFPWGIPAFEGRILQNLPERGDVVVFKLPGNERIDFIKRVIGLPGDTIEVRGGMVILNGKAAPRERVSDVAVPLSANSPCKVVGDAIPMVVDDGEGGQFCRYATYRETLPGGRNYLVLDQVENPRADDFGPVTIPAGFLFLMGDNRDDSLDSRFGVTEGGIGFVPVDNLVGRGLFNFWSTDGSATYWLPWTWFSALRGDRIGKGAQS
jgi:signal peptidase I